MTPAAEQAVRRAKSFIDFANRHDISPSEERVIYAQGVLDLAQQVAEFQWLFDKQQERMSEATAMWVAENTKERELILPDLGDLLAWLIERAKVTPRADL